MVVNEHCYKNDIGINSKGLLIANHVAINGDKHFAEIARNLKIPAYTVQYQSHRLKVRGIVELRRVGTLTFVHFVMPKAPEGTHDE